MEKIANNICTIYMDDTYEGLKEILNLREDYDCVLVLTDTNVYNAQGDKFIKSINSKTIYEYIVNPVENAKSIDVYEKIIEYVNKDRWNINDFFYCFSIFN